MTPEQENFDGLRRLLKLKRFEQPPPRYFNDFSRQVMARVKAGNTESYADPLDRLFGEVPWMQRLIEAFQAKPALAVAFGAAVCTLLIGGVIFSESTEYTPATLLPITTDVAKLTPATSVSPNFVNEPGDGTSSAAGTNNSLNVVVQPGGSLFDVQINPQPVSFQFPSGGN